MAVAKIKGTVNFQFVWEMIYGVLRYIVLEGSTRSGKTYGISQVVILYLHNNPNKTVTCFRKEEKNHVGTTQQDIRDVIQSFKDIGIPIEVVENKQHKTFTFSNGSLLRLRGTLEPAKLHGIKQDIAWLNEVMEIGYDAYKQISQRTRDKIIFDFNPSLNHHWLFDKVLTQTDRVAYRHSTFEDNPFLTQSQKDDIYQYDPSNPVNVENNTANAWHWDVYGLGKRGRVEGVIFDRWDVVEELPARENCTRWGGGMDFGFHPDPATLIECRLYMDGLYLKEHMYETNLIVTKNQADPSAPSIQKRLEEIPWPKDVKIYADSAQPSSIQDLRISGYNMQPSVKGKDSVIFGINLVKQFKLYVDVNSLNLQAELEQYKWQKSPNGEYIMGKPVDKFNHLIDPLRYWVRSEAIYHRQAMEEPRSVRRQLMSRRPKPSIPERRITC